MIEFILLAVVVAFTAYLGAAFQLERRRATKREQELLAAILAKNVGEYVSAIDHLRMLPKDKLAEMKLENDLAQAAVKLETGAGTPVR